MTIKFPPDMSDEQKNFIEDYFALMHMEESENPALYRQIQQLLNQIPPERRAHVAFGEAITRPLVEEYRKMKAGKT